jgi:hypothetical protein
MLLKPDSDFFRFFNDPSGKGREGTARAKAPSDANTGFSNGVPPK